MIQEKEKPEENPPNHNGCLMSCPDCACNQPYPAADTRPTYHFEEPDHDVQGLRACVAVCRRSLNSKGNGWLHLR